MFHWEYLIGPIGFLAVLAVSIWAIGKRRRD